MEFPDPFFLTARMKTGKFAMLSNRLRYNRKLLTIRWWTGSIVFNEHLYQVVSFWIRLLHLVYDSNLPS